MNKKIFLIIIFLILVTQVGIASSPGSFRSKETHGIGFSIIGGGGLGSSMKD